MKLGSTYSTSALQIRVKGNLMGNEVTKKSAAPDNPKRLVTRRVKPPLHGGVASIRQSSAKCL